MARNTKVCKTLVTMDFQKNEGQSGNEIEIKILKVKNLKLLVVLYPSYPLLNLCTPNITQGV